MTINGFTGAVSALAFSPNGRDLAVGSLDGTAGVYDVHTGGLRLKLDTDPGPQTGTPPAVVQIVYDHGGNHLAAAVEGSGGGGARIWNSSDPKAPRVLATGRRSIAFSHDDKSLAAADIDGAWELYDVGSGERKKRNEERGRLDQLTFSPDGERLAIIIDGYVRLYDTSTSRELVSLGICTGSRMCFNRDGTLLATCGSNGAALVWPALSCKEDDRSGDPNTAWLQYIEANRRSREGERPRAASTQASSDDDANQEAHRDCLPGCAESKVLLGAGGKLNRNDIDASHDTVQVVPGARITGTINIKVWTSFGIGGKAPVGATVDWGDRPTQTRCVAEGVRPGVWQNLPVAVIRTAPSRAGTYYIIVACRGEKTAEQIMSCTNWTCDRPDSDQHVVLNSGLRWDHGHDLGWDWSPRQFWEARAYGCTNERVLCGDGKRHTHLAGATWVRVEVTLDVPTSAPATTPAGDSSSLTALGLFAPTALQFPHD